MGIYGMCMKVCISCECEEVENVKVQGMLQSLTKTDLSVKVRGRMLQGRLTADHFFFLQKEVTRDEKKSIMQDM